MRLISRIAYYLFNFSNQHGARGRALREQVAALLRLKMWGVDAGEPHRAALAPGDRALIYVGPPLRAFVGRAEVASGVRDWTSAEARLYPDESQSGVLLADVELSAVVRCRKRTRMHMSQNEDVSDHV